MYNQKIDVADIMRKIKKEALKNSADFDGSIMFDIDPELEPIYREMKRINSFINNTRQEAEKYIDIGSIIPVSTRYPGIIRKLIVLLRRIIRKSTRFLFEEQIQYNKLVNANIKALYEEQLQLVKLLEYVNKSAKEQMKKETEISDESYVKFENRYRGTETEVGEKLKFYYKTYIEGKIDKQNDVILDLGCGRGEWLQILKENGYRAIGVDNNIDMIKVCKEKGLEVIEGDIMEYLSSCNVNSFKVITGFQVIEHLDLGKIENLIKQTERVLQEDGMLILETPNPRNLEVGSCNFYVDPTHIRPIHPDYANFLAENAGYRKSNIVYWKKDFIDEWIQSVIEQDTQNVMQSAVIRTMLKSMRDLIYCSPDFALIAYK